MRRYLTVVLASLALGGCLENAEELDRLVKEDAAFKQVIAARDESRRQIQLIRKDLLTRKKTLDAQVDSLRTEHQAYAKIQNQKIVDYHAAIEASRAQLSHELEGGMASLESKLAELAGYQKTIADVKKMLAESKGITLSKAEKQKWEERILMLSEKMRPLSEEIQDLKLQIRLKKQKIGYLR